MLDAVGTYVRVVVTFLMSSRITEKRRARCLVRPLYHYIPSHMQSRCSVDVDRRILKLLAKSKLLHHDEVEYRPVRDRRHCHKRRFHYELRSES